MKQKRPSLRFSPVHLNPKKRKQEKGTRGRFSTFHAGETGEPSPTFSRLFLTVGVKRKRPSPRFTGGTLNGTLSPSDDPGTQLKKLIIQNQKVTRKQMAAALGIRTRGI